MSKADLRKAAGVATSTFSRMNKSEYIPLEVLVKICVTLGCKMDDVVDIIQD
jgi:DNA-binding Xre family transcriptional regulator